VTLDELTSQFCEAMHAERDGAWRAGDVLLLALATNARNAPSAEAARAKRPTLFRAFAAAAGCTTARCRQLAEVAAEIEPGLRDATRSWSYHRAIVHAARRTRRPVAEVLVDASVNGWGQRELQALGAAVERVSWHGACGGCDFRVSVSCAKPGIRASHAGRELWCPICHDEMLLGRLA